MIMGHHTWMSTDVLDSDGDGVSDLNDQFPNNPDLWQDSDRDGVEDDIDAFPYNPSQWLDSDGDGFGDNPMDANADKFPNDSTQWSDVDGDGHGDNPTGNMPDAFPLDPTQWLDTDGDGYGDNPSGNMPDAFPSDITQWIDQDGDGLGDNQSGMNPDPFLFDSDNDGYNNTEDPLPMYSRPQETEITMAFQMVKIGTPLTSTNGKIPMGMERETMLTLMMTEMGGTIGMRCVPTPTLTTPMTSR